MIKYISGLTNNDKIYILCLTKKDKIYIMSNK